MELLAIPFHPPSCDFLPGPNILPSALFSNFLSVWHCLNVTDQVSHPYKTTYQIKVLYSLMFTFLSGQNDKRSLSL
jgi:hypothetical protein